jgi:hypothetical protein
MNQNTAVGPAHPGNHLVTNAPAQHVLGLTQHMAQQLGFKLRPTSPWSYGAQKGSLAVSILFGAFIAYCNFNVYVNQMPDGNTGVSIIRNKPWWTGVIGVKRVKNRADELGNAIGGALTQQSFAILAHQQT